MKALFLGLLLANILLFTWARWHVPGEPKQAESEPVPGLQLAVVEPAQSAEKPAAQTNGGKGADPAAVAGNSRCRALGPFFDLPEASQAAAALRTAGHDSRTRVAQGDIWAGLWVYLEDLSSRAEAQRVIATLKENGITDAYLLPANEQGSSISLGIFIEPRRAQRRAADVRKLGFNPTIAERTRKGTVYWLDIDGAREEGSIDLVQLAKDEGEAGGRILRLEVTACPAQSAER